MLLFAIANEVQGLVFDPPKRESIGDGAVICQLVANTTAMIY